MSTPSLTLLVDLLCILRFVVEVNDRVQVNIAVKVKVGVDGEVVVKVHDPIVRSHA